jgi:hypothetical protein
LKNVFKTVPGGTMYLPQFVPGRRVAACSSPARELVSDRTWCDRSENRPEPVLHEGAFPAWSPNGPSFIPSGGADLGLWAQPFSNGEPRAKPCLFSATGRIFSAAEDGTVMWVDLLEASAGWLGLTAR